MKFIKVEFANEDTLAVDATVQAIVFNYKASHWQCPDSAMYVVQTYDTVEEVIEKLALDERFEIEGAATLNLAVNRIRDDDKTVPEDARVWMHERLRSKAELLEFLKHTGLTIPATK